MKKLLLVVVGLALATSAWGFGLGDVGGGAALDTSKVDSLLAKIDTIKAEFDDINALVTDAKNAIEVIEEAHGITGVLTDADKLQELAGALTDDEKTTLQEKMTALADVPNNITALTEKIPATIQEVPTVITDLTNQASSNPTSLGQVGDLTNKLNEGKTKLEDTQTSASTAAEESGKLTTAIQTLTVG